ncbi:hypothetical protein N0V94_000595 [Neodidymelliopsis sp. IMI 364377]|nr:hypothetical protein N0V94_000595 [Neodidymelliopsis sp. IMI 364377]
MSTHVPLRIARLPAHSLRRQCLFQHRTAPSTPRCIAAASARAFSSTPARPYRKANRLTDTRMQVAGAALSVKGIPSPTVTSQDNQENAMSEDIGIVQNTIIRAPFSKLPPPTSWEFYSYFWSLFKSKMSALYTRAHFKRCVHKTGISSYMPVDFMKQKDLKNKAKKMYNRYYELLAAGDAKSLQKLCLPPFAQSLRSQIAARGPVKTTWTLRKFKSARIASHRCAPLGNDHPDTSYRQCVVRIESEQQLSIKPLARHTATPKARALKWAPQNAKKEADAVEVVEPRVKPQTSEVQTVVEYLVMQTRVIEGKEEDWKIWGFTTETTPAKMDEDELYWKRMLDVQSAA